MVPDVVNRQQDALKSAPPGKAAVLLALAVAAVGLALPEQSNAASARRILDLSIQPASDFVSGSGPIERSLGNMQGLHRQTADAEPAELAIRAGSLGLTLRPENDKLKPDLFYDVSGWRLRTRIMSGDSPLEIDGMLLRAAHSFPLFGDKVGTADLP